MLNLQPPLSCFSYNSHTMCLPSYWTNSPSYRGNRPRTTRNHPSACAGSPCTCRLGSRLPGSPWSITRWACEASFHCASLKASALVRILQHFFLVLLICVALHSVMPVIASKLFSSRCGSHHSKTPHWQSHFVLASSLRTDQVLCGALLMKTIQPLLIRSCLSGVDSHSPQRWATFLALLMPFSLLTTAIAPTCYPLLSFSSTPTVLLSFLSTSSCFPSTVSYVTIPRIACPPCRPSNTLSHFLFTPCLGCLHFTFSKSCTPSFTLCSLRVSSPLLA